VNKAPGNKQEKEDEKKTTSTNFTQIATKKWKPQQYTAPFG
jgi:hypothetical protein